MHALGDYHDSANFWAEDLARLNQPFSANFFKNSVSGRQAILLFLLQSNLDKNDYLDWKNNISVHIFPLIYTAVGTEHMATFWKWTSYGFFHDKRNTPQIFIMCVSNSLILRNSLLQISKMK